MKHVLVFPSSTDEAAELNRALGPMRQFKLFGAGMPHDSNGLYIYRNHVGALDMSSPDFVGSLAAVVEQHCIDFIYPASDEARLQLSRLASVAGAEIVASPEATCIQWPIKDTLPIEHDALYSVSCLSGCDRELKYVGVQELAGAAGLEVLGVDLKERLRQYAAELNDHYHFQGVWGFTVCEQENGGFELLSRTLGVRPETAFYRSKGVNLAALSLFDRQGQPIETMESKVQVAARSYTANRYRLDIEYDVVYVDLDDTVIVHGEVNPLLAAFLVQCRNKGKKTHLITKHALELKATLNKYRIGEWFDSIIHLQRTDEKFRHMTAERSIFIDDAYLERKQVAEQLGIPTFDVTAVECLLDWSM